MREHMKRAHEIQEKVCATCGMFFPTDSKYREHIVRAHATRRYKCQFCAKLFKKKVHLGDHEAIHTGESRYFCKFCDAKFKSQGNWQAHFRKLHPVEYEQHKHENRIKRYRE